MKKEDKKLFTVNVSFDTVFYGAEDEIINLVKENLENASDNCYPFNSEGVEIIVVKEILSEKDLPKQWGDDCLPWGDDCDFSIFELLK